MTRSALILGLALLAGCDRQPSAPQPAANAQTFDNAAAAQSIMQPEVVAESPPEPTPSPTPEVPPPLTTTVTFGSGALLDAEAKLALDRLVAALPPEARLVLRGHSDSPGSDAANLRQSRRRAEAVRDYLAEKGVAPARVELIALGETRPVSPNAALDGSDDPAGRARNRRVEVEALPAPSPGPTATSIATPG